MREAHCSVLQVSLKIRHRCQFCCSLNSWRPVSPFPICTSHPILPRVPIYRVWSHHDLTIWSHVTSDIMTLMAALSGTRWRSGCAAPGESHNVMLSDLRTASQGMTWGNTTAGCFDVLEGWGWVLCIKDQRDTSAACAAYLTSNICRVGSSPDIHCSSSSPELKTRHPTPRLPSPGQAPG